MLRELRIRNFAIIDRLDLEFPPGLVALTGETGAGKSILVGALGLALGERPQPEHAGGAPGETAVEAVFSGPLPEGVRARLEAAGLPAGEELVLRRLLPPGGKSRAYLNDAAVSQATLEQVGGELVDIHGQHQHQSLLRPETHLDFLDGFGGLMELRADCRAAWLRHQALRRERAELAQAEQERERRLEYLRHQEEELAGAELRSGEEEELRAERERLRHVGRLAAAGQEAEQLVYSGEQSAAGAAAAARRRLEDAAATDPVLAPLAQALAESQAALEEAGREIQGYLARLEADPQRLAEIEERLAMLARLRRKYGGGPEELLAELERVRGELGRLREGEARLARLERELAEAEAGLSELAGRLSEAREACARPLEERVVAELAQLQMARCRFEVRLVREEDPEGPAVRGGRRLRVDERGAERAEFLLSTNPGVEPRPLSRVASGGELSRVMLAIKGVLAQVDRIPTLVFDEVDIGIGGRVARLVGERLARIARARQVLCITHLAQIASLADAQYNIAKSAGGGRTRVRVRRLDAGERVEEVARMLGGRGVTAAVREHARELLRGEDRTGGGRA